MVPSFDRSVAEEAALAALYRRYSEWLRGRLRHRFDAQTAEDLVQEAYLRIAPYQVRGIRSPKSLLLRIASNLALDGIARDAVRQKHQHDVSPSADAFDSPHETLLLKEIVRSKVAQGHQTKLGSGVQ